MIWKRLKYFTKEEAWGNPDSMDDDFLLSLDRFRAFVGKPFQVTAGYATEGHSKKSYHYLGRAVDGRFFHERTKKPLSLIEHVLIAIRAPFNGVGIYTHSDNGPYLHFDNRDSWERKFWVCHKPGVYEPFTDKFLKSL